ncbi:hypothetical protein QBC44DRAFT_317659 [Cladorrhinum sp. PSN332]|nr:hypothetical protein QBC44DRAFT_317659 [Cladorrhinum sp. PSN332]
MLGQAVPVLHAIHRHNNLRVPTFAMFKIIYLFFFFLFFKAILFNGGISPIPSHPCSSVSSQCQTSHFNLCRHRRTRSLMLNKYTTFLSNCIYIYIYIYIYI